MPDIATAAAVIRSHTRLRDGPVDEVDNKKAEDKEDDKDVSDEAWLDLPDLPTKEELLANASSDDLPWFPLTHTWTSKKEYLRALYEILRFEGVEGLRYSIKTVRDRPSMLDDDNTCIYTKVRLSSSPLPSCPRHQSCPSPLSASTC